MLWGHQQDGTSLLKKKRTAFPTLVGALLILLLIGSSLLVLSNGQPGNFFNSLVNNNDLIYLPIVPVPDNFDRTQTIWSPGIDPGKNQVALFRHKFDSSNEALSLKLEIFADTHYEVWLDGVWIGRGPARFSRFLHEYDVYELESPEAGEHTLAVLVQWAPNIRRSESTRPYLQARIWAKTSSSWMRVTETSPDWKALISSAWNPQAVQIHSWNLIGPTELVDLDQLPNNWIQAWFLDDAWDQAIIVSSTELMQSSTLSQSTSSIAEDTQLLDTASAKMLTDETIDPPRYQKRSIPLLTESPIQPLVIDAGELGRGFDIREFLGEAGEPYLLEIFADAPKPIILQTVSIGSVPDPNFILVNGAELEWMPFHAQIQDLYQTEITLEPGSNLLEITAMPSDGLTMGVSQGAGDFAETPLNQGVNAGRRLLLAEPFSNPEAVELQGDGSLTINFIHLPAYVLLDLGRVIHGRISFTASGPKGSIVDVGWDERLLPDTLRALPFPGSLHPQWNQTDSWILDGSSSKVTTLDARSGRYVLIAAWGSGSISLQNMQVWEETYPLIQEGSFQSDDSLLNEIWQVGADTLRINMIDAYTDTPWRERGQWWGDAYVGSQINRVTYGDIDLLSRGVTFMAGANPDGTISGMEPNGQNLSILDYGMLWVHSLHETVFINNQRDLLFNNIKILRDFMSYCQSYINPDTGLIELPAVHWSKSAYIDTLGFRDRYGQSTTINALYYSTLLHAARLANAAGYVGQANNWREQAATLKANINTHLFLPDKQAYAGTLSDGSLLDPTVLSQAWPLAYEIVPTELREAVTQNMLDLLGRDPSESPVGTYGFHWVLKALGKQGKIDEALDLIKVFYGYMLDQGATTWWEWFEADQYYTNSLSHGWSGSPTWFLSEYVLGLQQTSPSSWVMRLPNTRNLDFVNGKLPLLEGEPVEATWERKGCGTYQVSIYSPANTQGWLMFPKYQEYQIMDITNSDEPRLIANSSQEITRVPIQTGTYLLSSSDECPTE
jgi:alpha-L-rhamnosidase